MNFIILRVVVGIFQRLKIVFLNSALQIDRFMVCLFVLKLLISQFCMKVKALRKY